MEARALDLLGLGRIFEGRDDGFEFVRAGLRVTTSASADMKSLAPPLPVGESTAVDMGEGKLAPGELTSKPADPAHLLSPAALKMAALSMLPVATRLVRGVSPEIFLGV